MGGAQGHRDSPPHPVGRDKSGPYDLLAALGEYSDILIIL